LAENEIVYYRQRMAELEIDLSKHPSKLAILKDTEKKRTVELEKALRTLQQENSNLDQQVKFWTKSSKTNQESRMIAEAVKDTLESNVKLLQKQLDEALSKNTQDDNIQHMIELENQVSAKNNKIQSLESKLATTFAKISEIEVSLEDAYTSLETFEAENEQLKKELEAKEGAVLELRDRVAILAERDPDALEMHHLSDSSLVESIKNDNSKLLSKNQELMMEINRLNEDLIHLNENYDELGSGFDKLELVNKDLSATNLNLQKELNRLLEENQKLTTQKDTVSPAIGSLPVRKSSMDYVNLELDAVKTKFEALTNQYAELKQSHTTTTEELNQKDLEISSLKAELIDYEVKLSSLRDAEAKMEELSNALAERQAHDIGNQELLAEMDELQGLVTNLESELANERNNSDKLKDQIEHLTVQIHALEV